MSLQGGFTCRRQIRDKQEENAEGMKEEEKRVKEKEKKELKENIPKDFKCRSFRLCWVLKLH